MPQSPPRHAAPRHNTRAAPLPPPCAARIRREPPAVSASRRLTAARGLTSADSRPQPPAPRSRGESERPAWSFGSEEGRLGPLEERRDRIGTLVKGRCCLGPPVQEKCCPSLPFQGSVVCPSVYQRFQTVLVWWFRWCRVPFTVHSACDWVQGRGQVWLFGPRDSLNF